MIKGVQLVCAVQCFKDYLIDASQTIAATNVTSLSDAKANYSSRHFGTLFCHSQAQEAYPGIHSVSACSAKENESSLRISCMSKCFGSVTRKQVKQRTFWRSLMGSRPGHAHQS